MERRPDCGEDPKTIRQREDRSIAIIERLFPRRFAGRRPKEFGEMVYNQVQKMLRHRIPDYYRNRDMKGAFDLTHAQLGEIKNHENDHGDYPGDAKRDFWKLLELEALVPWFKDLNDLRLKRAQQSRLESLELTCADAATGGEPQGLPPTASAQHNQPASTNSQGTSPAEESNPTSVTAYVPEWSIIGEALSSAASQVNEAQALMRKLEQKLQGIPGTRLSSAQRQRSDQEEEQLHVERLAIERRVKEDACRQEKASYQRKLKRAEVRIEKACERKWRRKFEASEAETQARRMNYDYQYQELCDREEYSRHRLLQEHEAREAESRKAIEKLKAKLKQALTVPDCEIDRNRRIVSENDSESELSASGISTECPLPAWGTEYTRSASYGDHQAQQCNLEGFDSAGRVPSSPANTHQRTKRWVSHVDDSIYKIQKRSRVLDHGPRISSEPARP
ncbi:hypothetical protein IE81DRAFT_323584 [Ceraceosorus guamensis]|uniref:Uncharacterized protein n=1 Tax=Ceraceosorus guamensis TaxID=1522189 RepID=A0A316VY62_9BASI|nr:hypothetical protein IE81DRAFT_323584 [Ceraceosorus guamensis]PWN42264.1 hypothetical protein IE81DRAFT_323584 [Ceraceosorus guamensis]